MFFKLIQYFKNYLLHFKINMRIFIFSILFLAYGINSGLSLKVKLPNFLKFFKLTFFFITFFCSSSLLCQEKSVPIKTLIESRIREGFKFKQISPFERDPTSTEQTELLNLKNNSIDVLKKGENDIRLQVTSELIHDLELMLTKVNPLDEGFYFQTSDGQKIIPQNVFFYRGIIKGVNDSKVTLTVRENFIRAHIVSGNESYILGQLGNINDKYVLMDEKIFSEEAGVVCEFSDDLAGNNKLPLQNDISRFGASSVAKKVSIYFETDFNLYQKLGSSDLNTQNYVLSMFNEIATVYSGIGIVLNLSSTFIWTTTDPYASLSTTSDMLTAFRSTRTGFDGDLAHLLSGKGSLGGIAYLGSLCSTYKYGVSASQGGNPSTLPRSSFTLIVVAHELGHSLGSPHTHACSWNGNNTRIDDCGGFAGYTEGTCANPTNPFLPTRGTIMSYCHLVEGVGAYFDFHPQVATRINNYVNSVGCLECTTIPTGSLCSSAITITVNGTYSALGPSCGNGCFTCQESIHANWYKFQAPSNGKITISSCNKGVDTRIWVHRGACGSFTPVGQNDDACTLNGPGSEQYASRVENIPVTSNQWYYLEWDNKWTSSGFDFEFIFSPDVISCTNQNITFPNSILNTGIYGTHLNIISYSIVQGGVNVQMTAAQTISLKSGFHAQAGATFSAKILTCLSEPIIQPLKREDIIFEDLNVYPNPFQQDFTATFSLADNEKGILIVTSLQGQQMITRIFDNDWGQKNYEEVFSLENLVPGIYFISLRTNQRNIHNKIIKAD
jgi:hypothetical protein